MPHQGKRLFPQPAKGAVSGETAPISCSCILGPLCACAVIEGPRDNAVVCIAGLGWPVARNPGRRPLRWEARILSMAIFISQSKFSASSLQSVPLIDALPLRCARWVKPGVNETSDRHACQHSAPDHRLTTAGTVILE